MIVLEGGQKGNLQKEEAHRDIDEECVPFVRNGKQWFNIGDRRVAKLPFAVAHVKTLVPAFELGDW